MIVAAWIVFFVTSIAGLVWLAEDQAYRARLRRVGDTRPASRARALVTILFAVILPIPGTWSLIVIVASLDDPFRGIF